MKRNALTLLFFLSGAASLAYEVVWTRLAAAHLGSTAVSLALVAASLMIGLSLGSWWGPKWAARCGSAVRAYAILQLIVAVGAALTVIAMPVAGRALAALYHAVSPPDAVMAAAEAAMLFAILLVPTAAMGATLPVLVRALGADSVPRLYAVNCLGAGAGAFIAGLALAPAVGVTATLYAAAGVDALIGLAVLAAARERDAPAPELPLQPEPRPIAIAAFAAGFLALSAEIVWFRLLTQVIGSAAHTLSMLLGTYLAGLGIGALLARRSFRPGAVAALYAGALAGSALFIVAAPRLFIAVAGWVGAPHAFTASLVVASAVMLIPTSLTGMLMPVLIAHAGPDAVRATGRICAFNTAGGVVGLIVSALWLMPASGAFALLLALATIAAIGATVWTRAPFAAIAVIVFGVVAVVSTGGPVVTPYLHLADAVDHPEIYRQFVDAHRWRMVVDGRHARVAVAEIAGARVLMTDGMITSGVGRSETLHRLLARIPVMLHENPQDALVVGLGAGFTIDSLRAAGVRRIRAVEIEPEVVRAAREWFEEPTASAADWPGLEIVVRDGRADLMWEEREYDLILLQPSHPLQDSMGLLYTTDFFSLARSRLREGGVFCAWFTYDRVPLDALRRVCASAIEAFGDAELYRMPFTQDAFIVAGGSLRGDEPPSDPHLAERGYATREAIEATRLLDADSLAAWAAGARPVRDAELDLAFAVRAQIGPRDDVAAAVDAWARAMPERAAAILRIEDPSIDWEDRVTRLAQARREYGPMPAWAEWILARELEALTGDALERGEPAEAESWADVGVELWPDEWMWHVRRAEVLRAEGRGSEAVEEGRRALDLDAEGAEGMVVALAGLFAENGEMESAGRLIEAVHRQAGESVGSLLISASVSIAAGRARQAVSALEQAVILDPRNPDVYRLLAHACAEAGMMERAREAARMAERLEGEGP